MGLLSLLLLASLPDPALPEIVNIEYASFFVQTIVTINECQTENVTLQSGDIRMFIGMHTNAARANARIKIRTSVRLHVNIYIYVT